MEKKGKKLLIFLAVLVPFVIVLVVILARRSSSSHRSFAASYQWPYLRLDCGASETGDTGWSRDEDFVKTGKSKVISVPNITQEMTTLRFFPENKKNCYTIKFSSPRKYHIRVGFLYGNYDGLSKPPSFDLELNGNEWTTVLTSLSDEPLYYEALYTTRKEKNTICLITTVDGQIPFISSIEATTLPENFYSLMDKDNKALLKLQSRVHFIRDPDSWQWLPLKYDDIHQRMWKTRYEPNYQNISSDQVDYMSLDVENGPPQRVIGGGIQAQSISDSITFLVNIYQLGKVRAYFVFYFMKPDVWVDISGIRKVQINLDGQKMAITEVPDDHTCQVITLYPVMVMSPVNVTISPVEGSTLPPIINAMEVYVASDLKKD